MKKIIFILTTIIVAFSFSACGNGNTKENAEAKRIARENFVKDSIANAMRCAEVVATLKPFFTEKKDEFSNRIWVEPTGTPRYRNQNAVYCYFQLENGVASNFRFVFQYYSSEWLFIRTLIFSIDENTFITIAPDMDTDCGYGGKVWEWCDESVNSGEGESNVNVSLITQIANAKSVKVKMNGSHYYDVRTLTESQIKSIKDTYDYYVALGGKF